MHASRKYAKQFFNNDRTYGFFLITLIALVFFLPVAIGAQSLFEAYPVFYNSRNFVPPQIKTPWVIDGGTHVRTTVPTTRLAVETLKSGHLPLWSPYDGAGENLLLGGLYNPIRLFFFALFDSIRAFDWAIILRFIAAGFGMFLFLKKLGLSRLAALFGAIGYMFAGYFIVFLTYFFLDIEAISPWVLWGIERYLKKPSGERKIADILLPGVLFGLLVTGGQPQSVILHSLLIGGYALWRVVTDPALKKDVKIHTRNFLLMCCIALLVALPYIADFLTLLPQALTIYDYGPFVQSPHGLEAASPLYLLHLFVTPSTILEGAIGGHLFNQFLQIVPYLAVPLILLFLLSFYLPRKPRYIYFFYAFVALAILKIFGFPIVNWIGALPILKNIGWHKLYGPVALSVSVVAAYAFHELPRARIPWEKFLCLLGLIPLAFAVVLLANPDALWTSYTPDFDFSHRRPETVQAAMRALDRFPAFAREAALKFIEDGRYFVGILFARSALFAGIALFLIFLAARGRKRATVFLLLFLIFESWAYMPKVRDGFRYFNPYVKPPFVAFLEEKAESDYFGTISTDYTFPVSLGDLFHIRKFQTTSAVFPKRFWYFMPDTIRKNDHDYFKLQPEDVAATPQKFFDAANLKYLITETAPAINSAHFRLAYNRDLTIYENMSALPRAYLAFQKAEAVSMEGARRAFYDASFDPHRSVVLEDGGKITLQASASGEIAQPAHVAAYHPDRVVIRADAEQDSILVLTDAFYSEWRAYLDGVETDIYPANVLFRGVFVPAGEHTVEFVLKPRWFLPAAFVSLAILSGVAIFLWRDVVAAVRRRHHTVAHGAYLKSSLYE